MEILLSPQHQKLREEFRQFVDEEIVPNAGKFDKEENMPVELIKKMGDKGYLGANVPTKYGGKGLDALSLGILNEEFGRGYSSTQNILTVYGMVLQAILRCGNNQQKEYWIPKIISGELIVAYGLTEPNTGSDIKSLETVASKIGDEYIIQGEKMWITLAQVASLFLVFAKEKGEPVAFLVERKTPGLQVEPTFGLLGLRANMLGKVSFDQCRIPEDNIIGKMGTGFSHVASFSLDIGRYTTAWGCVGLGQACLDACRKYTETRKQFGDAIKKHQLIQKKMSEMIVDVRAARQLCFYSSCLREACDPESPFETLVAKYYGSAMVNRVAGNAVQIHGANGCGSEYPVQRYYRDAKIMEIIEGTSQMHEIMIANNYSKSGCGKDRF